MPVPDYLKPLGCALSMQTVAEQLWDLSAFPTRYHFALLASVSEDKLERDKCIELSSSEGQEDWLNYCRRPRRTILEVLHDFHKSASKLTIEVLFELFSTIKPRAFSIAGFKPDQVDLLVAVVNYKTRLMKPRRGLCSNWLKGLQPGDEVFAWITPGTFKFPDVQATAPLIMVGPGTGLAPLRSLLQQRRAARAADAARLHLFFGCRYRKKDFHCGDELEQMAKEDKLSLYCAFSRDQDHKIYVQHKIEEHSKTLWDLLTRGAYIFISGNAKNMPDNVRDAIVESVISGAGNNSVEYSKDYLKKMEELGRLQVETWS